MHTKVRLVVPLLILCSYISICTGSVRYRVVYIPNGPCPECDIWPEPRDINNRGEVCGHRLERRYVGARAELWDPQYPETTINLGGLPDCGSTRADVEGMNDVGQIVGWDFGGVNCDRYLGCIWTNETGWVSLPSLPDSRGSQAFAINNLGQAVGLQGLTTAEPRSIACLWDPVLGAISLGRGPLNFENSSAEAVNDSASTVGYGYGAGGGGAFLWTPADGMVMIDGMNIAYAVNNNDTVAGFRSRTNLDREATIWSPQLGLVGLGWMPGDEEQWTIAHDINDQGTVIGEARIAPWFEGMWQTSFVWSAQRGMVDLNRRRDPCNPVLELRDLLYAVAINDAGVILAVPESEFVKAALLVPYIPGDLDENGTCDLTDLARLLSNFGRRGVGNADGDLDCQGDVDLQDLAILLLNFGDSLP